MAWVSLTKDVVKGALNVVSSVYDDEIEMLIEAGKQFLSSVGIPIEEPVTDPEKALAIITYCKIHFGEPENAETLQKSFDLQVSKLFLQNKMGWE